MEPEQRAGVVVAQGGLDYLKELQQMLVRGGLAAQVVRPPKEHCGT
ncbi:MAG: hypothetical protein IPK67_15325 [Planctomycetes bacterium]|nr:hypothetical protein [Planctomycetota bacterium]MBK8180226.1 hypothetical protein [Planctomycetota bacterium]